MSLPIFICKIVDAVQNIKDVGQWSGSSLTPCRRWTVSKTGDAASNIPPTASQLSNVFPFFHIILVIMKLLLFLFAVLISVQAWPQFGPPIGGGGGCNIAEYFDGSACQPCLQAMPHCIDCTDATTCTGCETGYVLNGTVCDAALVQMAVKHVHNLLVKHVMMDTT